jgi:hypothetical protein
MFDKIPEKKSSQIRFSEPLQTKSKPAWDSELSEFDKYDEFKNGGFENESDNEGYDDFENLPNLEGQNTPSPSGYLNSRQKNGKPLGADIIFEETMNWLRERRCDKFVNPRLVESYSQAFARFVQCEEAISSYGLLGKHPTTGAAIANPFVQMSIQFQKQANLIWYEIFDVVKQNCASGSIQTPKDDVMELLLTARRR